MSLIQEIFFFVSELFISIYFTFYYYFNPIKKSLKNQTILITGTGSGIGKSLAIKLNRCGAKIVLVDKDTLANQQTADQLKKEKGDFICYTCDLSDEKDISKFLERCDREVGKVDILINNAGVVVGKHFDEATFEEINKTFQVNLMSVVKLCHHFFPQMINDNKGHVVNISSLAGFFGLNQLVDYCSTKFSLVGFSEALSEELRFRKKYGVNVTCICPFYINTGMFSGVKNKFQSLFPIQDQEEVSDIIITSIQTNQKIVFIPKRFTILLFLKHLLPRRMAEVIFDVFQTNKSMATFVGKKKNK